MHQHQVYDTDDHFVIDPITKEIINRSEEMKLMQGDHNSERFTFEIPRYIDGHDMTLCDKIEVHYINIDSKTKESNKDVYLVDDMQLSPNGEDVVVFSWLISENSTQLAGTLNFRVTFKCISEPAIIDYQMSTEIFKGITVSDGISNSEAVIEQYSDVLEQWKQELNLAGEYAQQIQQNASKIDELNNDLSESKDYVNDVINYEINWNDGGYISKDDGNVHDETGSSYSGYVTVIPGTKLIITNTMTENNEWNAFYDANKTFLSPFSNATGEVIVPDGAVKMRLSKYSTATITIASNIKSYIDDSIENVEANAKLTDDAIAELKGDLDKLDTLFETGKNLLNPNTLKEFKSIDSNGNIIDANTEGNMFDISDFITIKKGETAYFSYNNGPISVLYAFSTDTSDTGWIRATANNYTASADGYIILRFNHASPTVEKMQVEIGTGVTAFEPFHYEIERYESKFGGIGGLSLANNYPLSDANEAENNRVYSIAYTGCNNLPVNGMQGTLITFQCGSNSGRTQFFIRAVKNTMYCRHYWSAWSAWSEIVNTSALNTVKSAIESKIPSIPYASVGMFEKIAIIGDSYASGEIYKQTDTDYNYTSSNGIHYYVKDYYNLSWLQVMARKNGVKGVNLSVGGLSTRTWLTDKNGLQKMLTEEAQNLYIMGLGINDVGKLGTSYIGSVSDIHDEDYALNADTFYGNYGKIIEHVKNHAPNCKIIMMAMANNTNATYVAYNTAIVNIANHYDIPVIKQYDDEFFLSDFYKNHMINGHPTADVYSGMALAIERLICDVIKDNYSYFVDYVG